MIKMIYAEEIKDRCPPDLLGVGSTSRRPRLSLRWRAGPWGTSSS